MTTETVRLLALLKGDSGITDLTGLDRIWGGKRHPPEEKPQYEPSQGAAIVFARDGGGNSQSGATGEPRFMFKCYGQTDVEASQLYSRLEYLLFHPDKKADRIRAKVFNARIDSGPIDGSEPDTDWPYELMYMRANFIAQRF